MPCFAPSCNVFSQSTKKRLDPTKPRKRRTQSAYMLWMNQEGRQNAKKRYPEMKVTAVASLCGEIWRGMSPALKKPWEAQAAKLKQAEQARYADSVAAAPPRKKRPPSAYMLWMNKTGRALAKSQYPDLKVTQIASLCGRYWREMDDSEKVRLLLHECCCSHHTVSWLIRLFVFASSSSVSHPNKSLILFFILIHAAPI